jgi:predicted O-methyltransferase YrrM
MKRLKQSLRFLRHYVSAVGNHAIHSPKIYRFYNSFFLSRRYFHVFGLLRSYERKLLTDERSLQISDLGAGSHANNTQIRRVGHIAKHAGKQLALRELFFRLTNDLEPEYGVELGTSLGMSSAYFGKACERMTWYTIEGSPEVHKVSKQTFSDLRLKHIRPISGNFNDKFPQVLNEIPKLDLLYVDGNHRKQATIDYFNQALRKAHPGTVMIFDDLYWSDGMIEAWETIKAHPKVSLSIDLFFCGFLFFDEEHKRDIKLRYPLRFL